MTPSKRKRLASLLSRVVDGRIDDSGMEELDRLMSGDEVARAYYLHYLAVHAELEGLGAGLVEEPPKVAPFPVRSRYPLVVASACALLLLGLGLWFSFPEEVKNSPAFVSPEVDFKGDRREIFAIIGAAKSARWDRPDSHPETGTRLGAGPVHLESGQIRLDFREGEKVTLSGPATFEVIDHQRLRLQEGTLLASIPESQSGFAVIMPTGAIMSPGRKFSAHVTVAGKSHVRVLEGSVLASTTNLQGNTSWEKYLEEGDEYVIARDHPPQKEASTGELLTILDSEIPAPPYGDRYARAVMESAPLAYWRFEVPPGATIIPNEMGGPSLRLGGGASINDKGVMVLDGLKRGHAVSQESFPAINADGDFSMEIWALSDSVKWQSLASLVLDGPRPSKLRLNVAHNPHLLLLERAGVSGSNWHHLHPSFALRSVFRSPAGYTGGVNVYSQADYLMHAWHHFVLVRETEQLLIYVDGELSGVSSVPAGQDDFSYHLLIGRLHTLASTADARSWSGAIDEVSLYDQALTPEEIARHYNASR